MSIEIKQLLIKSNIVQRAACAAESATESESESTEEQDTVKEQLLEECRRMIIEVLREKEER